MLKYVIRFFIYLLNGLSVLLSHTFIQHSLNRFATHNKAPHSFIAALLQLLISWTEYVA